MCLLRCGDHAGAERDASHAIAFLAAWHSADEDEEDPGYRTEPPLYKLLVKCCFRRATALMELYRVGHPVAKWCLRRALTDMAACVYSDNEDPLFAELLTKILAMLPVEDGAESEGEGN